MLARTGKVKAVSYLCFIVRVSAASVCGLSRNEVEPAVSQGQSAPLSSLYLIPAPLHSGFSAARDRYSPNALSSSLPSRPGLLPCLYNTPPPPSVKAALTFPLPRSRGLTSTPSPAPSSCFPPRYCFPNPHYALVPLPNAPL